MNFEIGQFGYNQGQFVKKHPLLIKYTHYVNSSKEYSYCTMSMQFIQVSNRNRQYCS